MRQAIFVAVAILLAVLIVHRVTSQPTFYTKLATALEVK